MSSPICYSTLPSPVGLLLLTGSGGALTGLWISGEKHCPVIAPGWIQDAAVFTEAASQLAGYFAGTRRVFQLPLLPGGTAFQQSAWTALQQIPYGQTRTYQQQAAAMQRPAAARAIGNANGRNPLSIIVPCHRVIGANGSLTGYGGGLTAKAWLLEHEQKCKP